MQRRVPAALALLVIVVVAGCGGPVTTETPTSPAAAASPTDGPTATPTRTATPTPSPSPAVDPASKVTVKGGDFAFDEALVYKRVVRLHGLTLAEVPNVTVHVRNTSSVPLTRLYDPSDLEETMGISPEPGRTAIAGLASGTRVYVYAGVVTTTSLRESVLAHEYGHVVQGVQQGHSRVARNVLPAGNNEGRVEVGVIEGASTFVQYRYEDRHMDVSNRPGSWREKRAGRTAFGAFLVAPYYFGQRYVDRRVESVAELEEVYDDPPQTTEQLIHGYDPDAQPPRDLAVADALGGSWTRAADGPRPAERTKGELFVRLVLERQLTLSRAADAAAGWGADRAVTYGNDAGATGHAWVLRWDDAAEADEFAAALRDYLDARGRAEGDGWRADGNAFRVVRPSDETVALLAGDEAFVSNAAVAGDDGSVTVTVEGSD